MGEKMKVYTKKLIDNLKKYYPYVLIFIVFMGVNFLKFDIQGVNMNVGRVLMLLTGIALLVITIKNKSIKILFTENKMIKYSLLFLTIWCIYSVCTIVKSKDMNMFIINNFFLVAGTMTIFYLTFVIKKEEQIRNIFRLIEIAMIINCLYTFYLHYQNAGQFGGYYYNNNDMATVLLLAIPIEIYLLYFSRSALSLILRVATLILYFITFMLLDSRACEIGLLIEAVIYLIAIIIIKRKAIFKYKLAKVALVVITIVTLVLGSKIVIDEVGTVSFEPNYTYLTSNTIRVNLILNGLEFLKENPLTGIGAGNIDYYLENEALYPTRNITKMHNFYLEILVAYGIIIFVGYLIFYGAICIKLLRQWARLRLKVANKMSALTLLVFWGSFSFSCISSSSNLSKEWIWLLIGITLATIKMKDDCGAKHEKQ